MPLWNPPSRSARKPGPRLRAENGMDGLERPQPHLLSSPPGTMAPMHLINYTPDTGEVHAPGRLAPIDKHNYSLMPHDADMGAGAAASPQSGDPSMAGVRDQWSRQQRQAAVGPPVPWNNSITTTSGMGAGIDWGNTAGPGIATPGAPPGATGTGRYAPAQSARDNTFSPGQPPISAHPYGTGPGPQLQATGPETRDFAQRGSMVGNTGPFQPLGAGAEGDDPTLKKPEFTGLDDDQAQQGGGTQQTGSQPATQPVQDDNAIGSKATGAGAPPGFHFRITRDSNNKPSDIWLASDDPSKQDIPLGYFLPGQPDPISGLPQFQQYPPDVRTQLQGKGAKPDSTTTTHVKGADGKLHALLVDSKTGATIKDMGVSEADPKAAAPKEPPLATPGNVKTTLENTPYVTVYRVSDDGKTYTEDVQASMAARQAYNDKVANENKQKTDQANIQAQTSLATASLYDTATDASGQMWLINKNTGEKQTIGPADIEKGTKTVGSSIVKLPAKPGDKPEVLYEAPHDMKIDTYNGRTVQYDPRNPLATMQTVSEDPYWKQGKDIEAAKAQTDLAKAKADMDKTRMDLQTGRITQADAMSKLQKQAFDLQNPEPKFSPSGKDVYIPEGSNVDLDYGAYGGVKHYGGGTAPGASMASDLLEQVKQLRESGKATEASLGKYSGLPDSISGAPTGGGPPPIATPAPPAPAPPAAQPAKTAEPTQTQAVQPAQQDRPGWPGLDTRLSGQQQPPTKRTTASGDIAAYDAQGNLTGIDYRNTKPPGWQPPAEEPAAEQQPEQGQVGPNGEPLQEFDPEDLGAGNNALWDPRMGAGADFNPLDPQTWQPQGKPGEDPNDPSTWDEHDMPNWDKDKVRRYLLWESSQKPGQQSPQNPDEDEQRYQAEVERTQREHPGADDDWSPGYDKNPNEQEPPSDPTDITHGAPGVKPGQPPGGQDQKYPQLPWDEPPTGPGWLPAPKYQPGDLNDRNNTSPIDPTLTAGGHQPGASPDWGDVTDKPGWWNAPLGPGGHKPGALPQLGGGHVPVPLPKLPTVMGMGADVSPQEQAWDQLDDPLYHSAMGRRGKVGAGQEPPAPAGPPPPGAPPSPAPTPSSPAPMGPPPPLSGDGGLPMSGPGAMGGVSPPQPRQPGPGWTPPVPQQDVAGIGHRFGQEMNQGEPIHSGVDLQAVEGTDTIAPVDGMIHDVTDDPSGLGLTVIIRGSDGSMHKLGHLKSTNVYRGMQVAKGQNLVSKVGSSGNTTGSHLHWAVRDQQGAPVDPTAALGPMASLPPVPGTEMMGPPGGSSTPPGAAPAPPPEQGAGADRFMGRGLTPETGRGSTGIGWGAGADSMDARWDLYEQRDKQGFMGSQARPEIGAGQDAGPLKWSMKPSGMMGAGGEGGMGAGLNDALWAQLLQPPSEIDKKTNQTAFDPRQDVGVDLAAKPAPPPSLPKVMGDKTPEQQQQEQTQAQKNKLKPWLPSTGLDQDTSIGAGQDEPDVFAELATLKQQQMGAGNEGWGGMGAGAGTIAMTPSQAAEIAAMNRNIDETIRHNKATEAQNTTNEDNRHGETMKKIDQDWSIHQDNDRRQQEINAETARHNQAQEQIARDQMQHETDIENMREASQLKQEQITEGNKVYMQEGQQAFSDWQKQQDIRMGILSSALQNPWLQKLTGVTPGPGYNRQAPGGQNISNMMNSILQPYDVSKYGVENAPNYEGYGTSQWNAQGGGGAAQQQAGAPGAAGAQGAAGQPASAQYSGGQTAGADLSGGMQPQGDQPPSWNTWSAWDPFQKAAYRTNVEAAGPGAWAQTSDQLGQSFADQGANPNVTQMQAAGGGAVGRAGMEMTADVFGQNPTNFWDQQNRSWSRAQAPQVKTSFGGTGGIAA